MFVRYGGPMLLRITTSAFNDRGALFMEQTLAALHQGLRRGETITLTLRDEATVGPGCDVPAGLRQFVTAQLLAHYPSAKVEPVKAASDVHEVWSAELSLRPDVFPLKRHPQFTDLATQSAADPLSGILWRWPPESATRFAARRVHRRSRGPSARPQIPKGLSSIAAARLRRADPQRAIPPLGTF